MPDDSFKAFVLAPLSVLPDVRATATERGCPSRSTPLCE